MSDGNGRPMEKDVDGSVDQVIIQQQIIVQSGGIANVGCPSSEQAPHSSPIFEGPGGVPITAVPYFAGRVQELEQLEQALVEHETVCVVATGIGGIGKTSLARQFVFARAAEHFPDGSAWLDAKQLTQDLDRVCRRFGWSDSRELSPAESVASLARQLHTRRFLLVLDNAGAELDPMHVPRPGGQCRTLLTTRERTLHDDLGAERLELDVWSVAESVTYLRARCERPQGLDEAELVPLVEFVGRLPLGVKLLASFLLKRPTLSLRDALSGLRAQPVGVLEKYRGKNPGLVATFQSTWDALEERSRRVLQALAVCALQTRGQVVGVVAGLQDVDEVLDELHGRSLIELDGKTKAPWRLHDVMRMFVAAQPGREMFEAAHLAWVEAHIDAHNDVLDHVAFEAGVDEVVVEVHRLVAAKELARAMDIYRSIEDHSRRVGAYPRAMELSEALLHAVPSDMQWASECMNRLGLCYQTLGDVPRAIESFQGSLAIEENSARLDGQATNVGNLGVCHRTLGDIAKAIAFFERALIIDETLGRYSGQAAHLGNLGVCYRTLGDIPKAIDLHKRALDLETNLDHHPGQANQLINLGDCHLTLGNITEATDYYERALAVEAQLGRLEGQANALGGLGSCYNRMGDVATSITLHEGALAFYEKMGRLEGMALQLGNLGNRYGALGDIPKAIDFLQRALIIDEKVGRLEGQATHLGNLGFCHQNLGDISKAIDFHERALAINERLGSLDGQASQLRRLARCYSMMADIPKAIVFHERALVIEEELGRSTAG